jgi:hypothetical protein
VALFTVAMLRLAALSDASHDAALSERMATIDLVVHAAADPASRAEQPHSDVRPADYRATG